MVKMPEYDAREFPIAEALLGLYDMAARWSRENGESHRDNFRLALMLVEVTDQNHKLEAKIVELKTQITQEEKQLAETNRAIIIAKSIQRGAFKG